MLCTASPLPLPPANPLPAPPLSPLTACLENESKTLQTPVLNLGIFSFLAECWKWKQFLMVFELFLIDLQFGIGLRRTEPDYRVKAYSS